MKRQPVILKLNLTGQKKMLTYVRLFSKAFIKVLNKVSGSRRDVLIKRFQRINKLVDLYSIPTCNAHKALFGIKPSKAMLRFVSAIGAGNLNKRWKNTH